MISSVRQHGFIKESFGRFQCTYCQENISGLRIRCVECDQFDLCLQCFSCGAEIGKHKNDHKYKFMDPGNFTLFGCEGWTAREDVRLLDAIEQYGYGNWVDIAKHIETRTPDEAQERYVLYYVNGNLGSMTLTDRTSSGDAESAAMPVVVDHTCDNNGALSSSLSSRLPPLQLEPLQIAQLNYMPLRDDFERVNALSSFIFSPLFCVLCLASFYLSVFCIPCPFFSVRCFF